MNHNMKINHANIGIKRRVYGSMLLLSIVLTCGGCGYRVRGSVGKLPDGIQSIGIPTFRNLTGQYRVEQIITSAVLKEFSLRTKVPVNSSSTGVDSVLVGDIVKLSATPVTFGTQKVDSQTYGATFMISVQISAKLVRLKDSSILWQNDGFLFREPYVLNANVRDFFSEENPALERLAQHFAASLASIVLSRSTP
jgi:hypothetical protein